MSLVRAAFSTPVSPPWCPMEEFFRGGKGMGRDYPAFCLKSILLPQMGLPQEKKFKKGVGLFLEIIFKQVKHFEIWLAQSHALFVA